MHEIQSRQKNVEHSFSILFKLESNKQETANKKSGCNKTTRQEKEIRKKESRSITDWSPSGLRLRKESEE